MSNNEQGILNVKGSVDLRMKDTPSIPLKSGADLIIDLYRDESGLF